MKAHAASDFLNTRTGLAALLIGSLLARVLVGLAGYSGAGDPPKYGDYEAQRHWMEIAVHTPISTWYTDGPHNNRTYWPLDYPPGSGYQSWITGQLLQWGEPAAIKLGTSNGYESPRSKLLMRATVLAADVLVYFPAAFAASRVFCSAPAQHAQRGAVLALLLLHPALLLMDHGHFQYNGISLGLSLGGAAAIAAGWPVLGSVLYCLALNHKQMALYYAPAFFGHLLGRCLQRPMWPQRVGAVAALGVTVIATFGVMWAPYLTSVDSALKVVGRIFPVGRGLYEDYLANFWCVTSVAVKWKALFAKPVLMRACLGLTVAAALPSMMQQIAAPSPRGLLLAMANSGLAFYMFAYQVHEKSLLMPLLPVSAMAAWEPELALWGPVVGAFSMFPLLERDGQIGPYWALLLAHLALASGLLQKRVRPGDGGGGAGYRPLLVRLALQHRPGLLAAAVAGALVLHAARAALPAPPRLPWLWDRCFITFAYVFVADAMVYLNWRQQHPERKSKLR